MGKVKQISYDVVKEFLDDTHTVVEDFVVLDGFNTKEEAINFANSVEFKHDDYDVNITVWECDNKGHLLNSIIVKFV